MAIDNGKQLEEMPQWSMLIIIFVFVFVVLSVFLFVFVVLSVFLFVFLFVFDEKEERNKDW